MTERFILGIADSIIREDFPCFLNKSVYNACTNVLNRSGWAHSGVYPFDLAQVWRVHKVDVAASSEALAVAGPLI